MILPQWTTLAFRISRRYATWFRIVGTPLTDTDDHVTLIGIAPLPSWQKRQPAASNVLMCRSISNRK